MQYLWLTLEGLQVLGVSAEGAPAGGQRHRHLRPVQQPPQPQALQKYKDECRENIGRHTWAVVLKFFVERTDFTKLLMSTKKQLNIIVNKKQRT